MPSKDSSTASAGSRVLRLRTRAAATEPNAPLAQPASEHEPLKDADQDAQDSPRKRRGSTPGFYSHTYLVHSSVRESPFDKASPDQNFRGFLNLALLLLAVQNIRLVIENATKYGLLLGTGSLGISSRDWTLALACLATMPLHLALAVLIERARSKEAADSTSMVLTVLHIVNITLEILTPTITVWTSIEHPLPGMAAIFLPTILFLKLISYMLVNRELKHERDDAVLRGLGIDVPKSPRPAEDPAKESTDHALSDAADAMPFDPNAIKYPNNVTLGNAVYFWLAPTLCYQPVYPRTRRIRRSYMLKRLLEMLVVSIAIVVLTKQYALPTLVNSTAAMRDASWGKLLERLLKLSMISLYIWILSFFLFFHSFLSAFAELLRFGDRRFFGEWWNSTDFSEYWRLWNQPVSSWAKRHIYLPLIKNHSLSPFASQLIVFLVSAALHELIIGVPTKTVYGFAAGAMLLQVPMISLGRLLSAARERFGWRPQKEIIDTIGNLHFWMSFCIIGQPLVVMLYWFDWQRKTRAA